MDERLFVPRVEAAFEVHSPSTRALSRGTFDVLLTAVPRPGSSMAGRFAHVLPPEHQDALAATYDGAPDGFTAQLVFPPRRHHNENVTRTPLLPHVIELSGHQETDEATIPLADIAVTADRAASTSCSSPLADASTCASCTPWKAGRCPATGPVPRRCPLSSSRAGRGDRRWPWVGVGSLAPWPIGNE